MTAERVTVTHAEITRVLAALQSLGRELTPGERAVLDALLRAAGMAESDPPQYNPFLPGVHENPCPHFARLRTENPAHWSEAARSWVLTRYADVVAAFHHPALSSRASFSVQQGALADERRARMPAFIDFLDHTLNQSDPPEHTAARRWFTAALSAVLRERGRAWVRNVVDALLAPLLERGEIDLVAEVARPLPARLSADLLGISAEQSDGFLASIEAVTGALAATTETDAALERGNQAVLSLERLLRERVRTHPGEWDRSFLGALLRAGASPDVAVRLAMHLPIGAQENLRNMLSVALFTLLSDRALWESVEPDPERLGPLVEELLRDGSISQFAGRTAVRDVEIGGRVIPAGSPVLLCIAAANRDEARFPDGESFDPHRRPNPHIAFGAGAHVCPGASLTRLAATELIAALRTHMPDLALVLPVPVWRNEHTIRGLATLPARFTPGRRG